MKNLLVYDFLMAKGGAEGLSLQLCKDFASLELLVGFIDKTNFPNKDDLPTNTYSLNKRFTNPAIQALLLSRAFARCELDLNTYEKVLFSGSYGLFAVNKRAPGTTNLLYCHTPPRFIYDLRDYYQQMLPAWQRPLFGALVNFFKPRYEQAVERMDLVIANSNNVKQRIAKYLNKEAVVVYPPCNTERYKWLANGDYYLSTARLEGYKRVALIVEAFKKLPDKKLIVASGGSQLDDLRRLAEGYKNIYFTGWISEQELQELVGRCIATIYIPTDEDFGISPVESMAAGKPVIGVNEGGIRETVINNGTGILVPSSPAVDDIIVAVNKMTPNQCLSMRPDCEGRAQMFSNAKFKLQMQDYLG